MARRSNQPKVQTMEATTLEINTDLVSLEELKKSEQPMGYAAEDIPKHQPNQPENGCYGEIKLFCGREIKPCHFREFINSSPSGLYAACTRCKDLRLKIDTNSKI